MSEIQKIPVPFERSLYLLHPYNAMLISSKGKDEEINIMTVAWIIPVSVNPPLLVMSIRPQRHSYELITGAGEFIVNIPTYELAQKVLFCGRRSGRKHEKFKELSFTPQKAKKVDAPVIKECIGHLECRVTKIIKIGDHDLIVGEIVAAYALNGYFNVFYDVAKFHPCLHLGKNFFTTCIDEGIEPEI